jgi:hypothetical protein
VYQKQCPMTRCIQVSKQHHFVSYSINIAALKLVCDT